MIIVVLIVLLSILIMNFYIHKDVLYPPFIFSTIWFIVLLFHFLFYEFEILTLYELSEDVQIIVIAGVLIFSIGGVIGKFIVSKDEKFKTILLNNVKFKILDNLIFLIPLIFLPLVLYESYVIASALNTNNLLLSLRYQTTYAGMDIGYLKYITTIAIFNGTFRFTLFNEFENVKILEKQKLIISILLAIIYGILSTGRTLLFFIIIVLSAIIIIKKGFSKKVFIISFLSFFVIFFAMGVALAKSGNIELSFTENLFIVFETFMMYMLGPISALDIGLSKLVIYDQGQNSLRFFYAFFHSVGLTDTPPAELIQEFIFVPFRTNVYTFYYTYIKDFGVWYSLFILFILSLFHTSYYYRLRNGSIFSKYMYGLLLYPVVMTIFQDQLFTLLSTWIQFAILILLYKSSLRTIKIKTIINAQ